MAQVQIEFSKIAVSDRAGQTRPRAAGSRDTHDFAGMVDAASHPAAAPAARRDARVTSNGEPPGGSSPHRTDSAVADRSQPDDNRTAAVPGTGDARQSGAADEAAAVAKAVKALPHGKADSGDDSDQETQPGSRGGNGDVIDGVAVLAPVIVAAPVPAETPAQGVSPADEAMTNDSAVEATTGAGTQPSDTARTTAAAGQPVTAPLIAVLAPNNPDAKAPLDDDAAAAADVGDAATAMPRVEAKIGQTRKIRAGGAEGAAGARSADDAEGMAEVSAQEADSETTADELPDQAQPPNAADAAKSPTNEAARKGGHASADGPATKSATKDTGDDVTSARANLSNVGAVQAATDPSAASVTLSAGIGAGITAVGTAAGAAAAASPTAAASRSDGAGAPVTLADLGIAIATQAKDGHRSFDIRLDPPELGHIHVRLDLDRDGNVTSRLVVDRADTLDLLRRDAPQLQRALQDAGLKADAQTMQFSLRDQNAGQQGGYHTPRAPERTSNPDSLTRLDEIPSTYGRLSIRIGGLDIRI